MALNLEAEEEPTDDVLVDAEAPPEDTYAVEDEDGEAPEEIFTYDEDELNLCAAFDAHQDGKAALKKLSEKIVREFDQDFESCEVWRKRVADDWRLFAGDMPEKDWPYKDAANVHVPIMLENITRVSFRAFGELFGDWSNVFGWSSLGPHDDEQAALLSMHSNWQLRNQIIDFPRQMHRALLNFFTVGDLTFHSFYDEDKKIFRHEMLTADEFVIPYVFTTTMPDYSDVPHMTKVVMKYRHEIEAMRESWFGVDELLDGEKPSYDDEPETPLADAAAEIVGQEKPTDDEDAPRKILWYEGWAELPNQPKQRYIQAIVDYSSKIILRLTIHEEAPWQDKARYKREVDELARFRAAQVEHQMAMQNHDLALSQVGEATAMGAVGPEQAAQSLETLNAQMPQPPLPPSWMQDPEDQTEAPKQPDKKPIYLFTHAVCIEPARGSLGLGYGRGQADHNRAADTSLSQFTDAATLANCKTFLAAGNVQWDGEFNLKPGAINRVKGISPSEMKEGLIPFAFADANGALLTVVDRMSDAAESSIQGPAVLSGESGKSGETARGISARIEQATKQLSVVTAKFAKECLMRLLLNQAYLNSIFLPEEELFQMERALIPESMIPPFKVGRAMYERNFQLEIRSDLRFATQAQRVGEADDALKLIQTVPQMQQNIALIQAAVKKCLEARGQRDLLPLLGPAAPPPMTPLGLPPPMPPPPPGVPPSGAGGPPGPGGASPNGIVRPGGSPHGPPPGPIPRPPPPMPGNPH